MSVIANSLFPQDPRMKVILCHYPLDGPITELYPPSASNGSQYKMATKSLYKRLRKKGLLDDFHQQMEKSVLEKHWVMLTQDEAKEVLKSLLRTKGRKHKS